jgi:hypothetical protein
MMTTETFDQAVSHATNQENAEVRLIKETYFAAPLAELQQLRTQWGKQRERCQTRLAHIQQRIHQAGTAGADPNQVHRLVGTLVRDLAGGAREMPGLLNSIGPQIDRAIENMERLAPAQVPLRGLWLAWTAAPERVKDNLLAVADRLDQLEAIIADGGPLQQLVDAAAARKSGAAA